MGKPVAWIDFFNLQPGRVLAGKYVIDRKLGGGWEGEVYKVIELLTGVHRAAKPFKSQHNEHNRAVKFYAQKLERLRDDVADIIRLLYDAVGGQKHYAKQPPEIKTICKGLRRDLIGREFPTASHLREYLESFDWSVL
jgi:hypothetical protein